MRFVLDDPRIHAALIGFGTPEHVDELCDLVERKTPGPGPAVR
jgi:predicted aldo/keto reductase-like oxidoreductase